MSGSCGNCGAALRPFETIKWGRWCKDCMALARHYVDRWEADPDRSGYIRLKDPIERERIRSLFRGDNATL